MAIVGEVQDEVGNQPLAVIALQTLAALVSQRLLGVKLFTLLQLQVFQQLFQLQFTEVALYLDLACQRTCQPVGSLTDGLTFLHVDLDALVQSGQRLCLLFLSLVEGFLHVLQTLLQWVYDF